MSYTKQEMREYMRKYRKNLSKEASPIEISLKTHQKAPVERFTPSTVKSFIESFTFPKICNLHIYNPNTDRRIWIQECNRRTLEFLMNSGFTQVQGEV